MPQILILDPPQPPAANPADYVKNCEKCGGWGNVVAQRCQRCDGAGIILLPLPADFRPRCGGCGKFLKRTRNRWGEWPMSCWDCAPDWDYV